MNQGLDSNHVIDTINRLHKRISERFPRSGLGETCSELFEIAGRAHQRSEWIAKPLLGFRYAVGGLSVGIVAVTVALFFYHPPFSEEFGFTDYVTVLDAGMNVIVLVGIALIFLITLERRIKRTRALLELEVDDGLSLLVDVSPHPFF